MSYKSYLAYLNDLGLSAVNKYDYQEKALNVNLEIERFLIRSSMMFQWHGLPDTIPQRQLELMLQTQGYAIIGQINGDLYACYGGLGGMLDEYFRPTKAIVSIPYLRFNAEWEIGTDCVVVKNDLLRQGLLPLYAKYLTMLNETEITLMLSLINQRVQSYISASDDNTIKSAKEFLDGLRDGKQGVIADNAFLESLKIVSDKAVGNNLDSITEVLHYLRGQLFNEIGLATNYNLKKERITQAEVELNTDNLYPFIDDMMFCRRDGIEDCYDLFGVDWKVEFNSSWDYRIMNGEQIVTEGNGLDDGSMDSVDSDNVLSDGVGLHDVSDDSGNENGMEEVTDKIQDVSDVVADVSDGDNDDSGDSVDSVLSDNVDDVDSNSDVVASVDNTRDLYPDDKLDEVVEIVADLASETADNMTEGNVDDVGLSNDEVIEVEKTVTDLINNIAENMVDDTEDNNNEKDK